MLQSKPLKRKKYIPRFSPRSLKYEDFRKLKLLKDRNEVGLIQCQDYKIGLPACMKWMETPDLHHVKGRSGDLLFDERHMVWLARECHNAAHN